MSRPKILYVMGSLVANDVGLNPWSPPAIGLPKKLNPRVTVVCSGITKPGTGSPDTSIRIEFSEQHDNFVPVVSGYEPGDDPGSFLCPGEEMDMVALSEQKHGKLPDDYLLGVYQDLRIGYTTDEAMRDRAASGGIIPAVLTHFLEARSQAHRPTHTHVIELGNRIDGRFGGNAHEYHVRRLGEFIQGADT